MKTKSYTVRPSNFGGKWIAESVRGISTQHDTKEAAVRYALGRAEKVIYAMPIGEAHPVHVLMNQVTGKDK